MSAFDRVECLLGQIAQPAAGGRRSSCASRRWRSSPGAIYVCKSFVPVLSLGVLYLFAVLPVAVLFGRAYAIPVALASAALFNFLFLPPLYTFRLSNGEHWFALAVYLVVGIVASDLAVRARQRAAGGRAARAGGGAAGPDGDRVPPGRERRRPSSSASRRRSPTCCTPTSARIVLGRSPRSLLPASRRSSSSAGGRGSGRSTSARARSRASPSGGASCPRSPRSSPSPATASGSRARRSRPRRCGGATRSRPPCSRRSATTCARRSPPSASPPRASRTRSSRSTQRDRAGLLETVRLEVERLERVVGNLLDLSRLQAGAAEPAPRALGGGRADRPGARPAGRRAGAASRWPSRPRPRWSRSMPSRSSASS